MHLQSILVLALAGLAAPVFGSPIESTKEERADGSFLLRLLHPNGNPGLDARFLLYEFDGMGGGGIIAGDNIFFFPHDQGDEFHLAGGTLHMINEGDKYGITHLKNNTLVQGIKKKAADVHLAFNSQGRLAYKGDETVWNICDDPSSNGPELTFGPVSGLNCVEVLLEKFVKKH